MFYRKKPESSLSELAKAISKVDGVIAAILFGSRARGDADGYSDYDILVIFQSDEARRKNWDGLHEEVSKIGLFTQVLAYSLREVREKIEPTFLAEVLKHGRMIFSRYPIEMPAAAGGLSPARIITYDLMNLSLGEKQRFCYRLFGKRAKGYSYEGELAKLGGSRLGDGCILVPEGKYGEVEKIFAEFDVKHRAISAYVSTGYVG